ncbi:hypothetical protein ACFC06_00905 [Nocardia sp. NPDC056064]|uniref:hypothetical protein n=1 Tax=Nocardia sp. NPDC056064 TaxID=3345701 RepID=UPI0035E2ED99
MTKAFTAAFMLAVHCVNAEQLNECFRDSGNCRMIDVGNLDNGDAVRFVGGMAQENSDRTPGGREDSSRTSAPAPTVGESDRLVREFEAVCRRQRNRAFAAGLAGGSLGRLLGRSAEKLLDTLGWFGLG